MRRIRLLVPDLPSRAELAPYLERIDAERWYTNFGPLVRKLEEVLGSGFAAAGGAARIVTIANATLGLELGLLSLRLPRQSRVLVPALTFVASASAILRAECEPVFCDVAEETWILTPETAATMARKAGAAAVMPVATYGQATAVEEWDRFSEKTGIKVLIDAAGAYGNQARAGRCGAVFSLHATKSLGAAEGGFLVSTDAGLISDVRERSNFGIDLSSGDVARIGTNAKLSEYHAAVALASLDRWAARRAGLVALHRSYLEELALRCPSVQLQRRPADGVYTILPVLLPAHTRAAEVQKRLDALCVETRRWYCPILNHHSAFRQVVVTGDLAVSEMLSDRLLALPFHSFLSPDDVSHVCGALAQATETR